MRIFSSLYDRMMVWSRHRHAPWYLSGLSFAESSFFPIPPDVMLAPMSMAKPQKAWWFAVLTTVASVLGGLLGWMIGHYAFELIAPLVTEGGRYAEPFAAAEAWFEEWGVWAIFIAGFSPIPYKVFTISAGVLHMALIPFLIASVVGRGARFFLVAAVMAWGGERMEATLRQYVDRLGWIMVILVILVVIFH
jgi:membrane protein YqaA with SNARE-associated domain